jgi:hypothetical protein
MGAKHIARPRQQIEGSGGARVDFDQLPLAVGGQHKINAAQAAQGGRIANPVVSLERLVYGSELEIGRSISFGLLDVLTLPQRRKAADAELARQELLLAASVVAPLTLKLAPGASVIAPPVLVAFRLLAVTLPSTRPPVPSARATPAPVALTAPPKLFVALLSVTSAAPPLLLAARLLVPLTLRVELEVWVIAPPVLVALRLLAVTLPSTKGPAL